MTEGSKSQGPDVYEQIMTRSGIRAVQGEYVTDDGSKNVFLSSLTALQCLACVRGVKEMAC